RDCWAWGATGHEWISGIAIDNLPDNVPAFMRTPEAATQTAVKGRELDRPKGGGKMHDAERYPGHYIVLADDRKGDLVPSPKILSTDPVGKVAPPIFTSVGQDAMNDPKDVFVIQTLLNDRLPEPHTEVPVTGSMDPGTILAIKAFQAV